MLGKTIGQGTFGKVKVGTHILTGQKVAVKILEKQKIQDVSDVERVAREIHILKIMRHPHIIQLYEIIETPRQLYLIMEFASSGELFDYIVSHTRVKQRQGSRFFQQILSGVQYVHKLNVVHRDLKPQNLLLDYQKNIKLVDFGLSNTYTPPQTLKTACGSPCYAAPEMIAGKRYKGRDVDVWSCGVILFAMLCGYLPFQDPNTAQLYKKILNANYKLPKFLSSDARDLIQSVLNTDPTKRFKPDDIKKHPWYLQTRPRQTEGIIVGVDPIPVDMDIINSLDQFGINLDYAQKCVEANKHNHVTTTYYLLLKRHIENGGSSVGDLFSEEFLMFQKQRSNNFDIIRGGLGSVSQTGGLATSSTNSGNSLGLATQPEAAFAKTRKYLDSIANQMRAKKRAESTGGSSSRDRQLSFTGGPVNRKDQQSNSYSPSHKEHPITKFIPPHTANSPNNTTIVQSQITHQKPHHQPNSSYNGTIHHYPNGGQTIPPGTAYSSHRPHISDIRRDIVTSMPSTSVGRPRDKVTHGNNNSPANVITAGSGVNNNALFEKRLPEVKRNAPLIGFRDPSTSTQKSSNIIHQNNVPHHYQHPQFVAHSHHPSLPQSTQQQANGPPLLVLPNFVTQHKKANSIGNSGPNAQTQGSGSNQVHSALKNMLQMASQSPGTAHNQARGRIGQIGNGVGHFGKTFYNTRVGTAVNQRVVVDSRGGNSTIGAQTSHSNSPKPISFPTRSPAFPQPLGNVVSRIKRLRPPSRGDAVISKPKNQLFSAYRPSTRTNRIGSSQQSQPHDLNQTAPIGGGGGVAGGGHYLNSSIIEPSTTVNTSVLQQAQNSSINNNDDNSINLFKKTGGAPLIKTRQIAGTSWNFNTSGSGGGGGAGANSSNNNNNNNNNRFSPRPVSSVDQHYAVLGLNKRIVGLRGGSGQQPSINAQGQSIIKSNNREQPNRRLF